MVVIFSELPTEVDEVILPFMLLPPFNPLISTCREHCFTKELSAIRY